MSGHIHLIKLSVGTETPETLDAWHQNPRAQGSDGNPRHITRMWPKREAELLDGGSIYWVIKGFIQARQKILRLDEVIGQDGIRRCAIVLEPGVIKTTSAQKRPFQGWRYLKPQDAPLDLPKEREAEQDLPPELQQSLADIGLF